MADIPKVVSARLMAAASFDATAAAAHPNAEMLAAFAEQALSLPEREQMLGHLALCAGCREVIALTMPKDLAADSYPLRTDFRDAGQSKEGHSEFAELFTPGAAGKNWWFGFARPSLGWAALAAGVALAASVLVLHPLQQRQAPIAAAKQAVVPAQISAARDSDMVRDSVSSESKTVASLKSKPVLLGETRKSEDVLTARNVSPIQKAKPVLGSEDVSNEGGNQPALGHNPQTPLRFEVADGVLRRSTDGGENWESVLHADLPLQCYVSHNREVWAGGQSGTLFHSEDSGKTWTKVQIAKQDQAAPASDIAHIDARWNGTDAASEIIVSNKAMETWSSLDGGRSWRKK